jgi:hypothetical protein
MTRRTSCFLAAAAILAALAIFHAPLLRGLARPLVVDQTSDDCDTIGLSAWGRIAGDSQGYDFVARWWRERPSRRVLLIGPSPLRVEQASEMPSFAALARRELIARGVPPDAISLPPDGGQDDWRNARSLARWLGEHPAARICLLCGQFRSAVLRHTLDAVLQPAGVSRVRVCALVGRNYSDATWWQSRRGWREFGGNWLLLMQNWFGSGNAEPRCPPDADEYERAFLQDLAARMP